VHIVGREAELKQVRQFLAEARAGLRALHLHGEAGIGKSTIWQRALVEAAERGYRVVTTRPAEAEARLPFAGLNDLFGDLVDDVRPDLPAPQRLALDVALLRASFDGPRPEPLAISLAVLGLLRAASVEGPLVVAIDDVPWLDDSSATVVEFALRRLDSEPIGLLLAERRSGTTVGAPRLVSMVPADRLTEVPVAPLSARDTDRLLSATLDLDLAPSSLSRLHRTSGATRSTRSRSRAQCSGAG